MATDGRGSPTLESNMEDRDLFTLFIHHGGYLGKHEGLDAYLRGFCGTLYDVDQSSFNLVRLHRLIRAFGYASWDEIWYRIPRTNIFKAIKGDGDIGQMMNLLPQFSISVLHVYVGGCVDDKSGRVEAHHQYKPTWGRIDVPGYNDVEAELNEREAEVNDREAEPLVDLGGIDKADADGVVTQENEDARQEFDIHWGLEGRDQGENEDEEDEDYVADEDDDFGDAQTDDEYIEARRNLRESLQQEVNRLLSEELPADMFEEPLEQYLEDDADFYSGESDSDDDLGIFRRNKVVYDPRCDHKSLELVIGMRFQDGWQCKRALTTYSIEHGKFVQFRKVYAKMCAAKCSRVGCPWKIYASYRKSNHTFCLKTYKGDHKCARHMSNKLLTAKWIAMKYVNVFRSRPNYTVDDLRKDIVDRYGYDIPKDRLYNAKTIAHEWIRGSVVGHYALIRRYVAELRRVDREGRFELLLDDDHMFKALYLGFSSLIKGFQRSCRPVIGLDGCHLKTFLGGILLCAVAKDGNDGMFPIAWAVVEVENEDCWGWFMKCLIADLKITDGGSGYTFISDQQKGLENAVKTLTPFAEHRNCARHVWMNWKKHHPGQTLKNMFTAVVNSTTPQEYQLALEVMKKESVVAYQDFINRDTHRFCKAFFSTSCKSDDYTNNISETFNGYILAARGKHVIHMCEEIRSNLMARQVKLKAEMSRVNDRLCPNIRKTLEEYRVETARCSAKAALNNQFKVYHGANKYSVSLQSKTCTSRSWDLTGIPCVHGVAAYNYKEEDAALHVSDYYTVERYLLAYEEGLEPLNSESMWPIVEGFTVKPPRVRPLPGRPKKKRIRSANEDAPNPRNPTKLSQKGMAMHCTNCGGTKHNSRTCKNHIVVRPEQPKRKRGRPAKEKTPATKAPSSRNVAERAGGRGRGGGLSGRGIYVSRGRGGAGRGGAVRGGGRRANFGSASHIAAERNFAARGCGVFIGETDNIYYHPPGSSVVHTSHASASSTMEAGPSTQESRAPPPF